MRPGTSYQAIYAVVRRIPRGRVATYGQIAQLAGLAGQARQVGYALSALGRGTGARRAVPWQRVINARGEVSVRKEPGRGDAQRAILEAEAVEFGAEGRVDLERYGWRPRRSPTTGARGATNRS